MLDCKNASVRPALFFSEYFEMLQFHIAIHMLRKRNMFWSPQQDALRSLQDTDSCPRAGLLLFVWTEWLVYFIAYSVNGEEQEKGLIYSLLLTRWTTCSWLYVDCSGEKHKRKSKKSPLEDTVKLSVLKCWDLRRN